MRRLPSKAPKNFTFQLLEILSERLGDLHHPSYQRRIFSLDFTNDLSHKEGFLKQSSQNPDRFHVNDSRTNSRKRSSRPAMFTRIPKKKSQRKNPKSPPLAVIWIISLLKSLSNSPHKGKLIVFLDCLSPGISIKKKIHGHMDLKRRSGMYILLPSFKNKIHFERIIFRFWILVVKLTYSFYTQRSPNDVS